MVDILEKTEAPPEIYFDTFEEWQKWAVKQEESTEWVNGKVIWVHRDSEGNIVGTKYVHNRLILFLARVLQGWLERIENAGQILGPEFVMSTEARPSGREPDLLFIAPENGERIRETFLDGPADLVIEIMSPESIDRDRDDKFFEYQAAGIREYWLIDPETRGSLFFRLNEQGVYVRIEPTGGTFVSEVIPGFSLRPEWFWQASLPMMIDVERFWNERIS